MPEQFTEFADWTHMQDLTAANEIIQAYNERRQCVDSEFTPVELLTEGDHAQDCTIWRGMQTWVTQQAGRTSGENRWLNYTVTIEGESEIPFMTLVDFKSITGLNEGPNTGGSATVGWRRATSYDPAINDWTDYNDPMYEYGPIQAGDIRGPWVFADLQKAFDALRQTAQTTAQSQDVQIRAAGGGGATEEDALSDLETNWDEKDWVAGTFGFSLFFTMEGPFAVEPFYRGSADRSRTKYLFSAIPVHLQHEAIYYSAPNFGIFGEYNNADDPEPNEYVERETFATDQTDERLTGYTGNEYLPKPTTYDLNTEYEVVGYDNLLVLKWQFSHTLPEPE